MKKLTYLIIVLTIAISGAFVSCNAVEDLLEITLENVTFNVDINVLESAKKADSYEFAGSGSIDPSAIPELQPYLDLIRGVQITEVKVTVISVTPVTGLELTDASFTLTDDVTDANFTYSTPAAIPLTVGTEFIIDSSTPGFSVASDIISNLNAASVSAIGNVNETGFILGFNYSIKADITVGVAK